MYLYCQAHAGEIATSGVCLETAERLVRNYGSDPQDDGARGQPRDLPRSADQRRWRDPLDLRLAAPDQHGSVCYDPSNTENLGDPANRNGYGVNINRNFSIGSFFDGYSGANSSCWGGDPAGPFEPPAGDANEI